MSPFYFKEGEGWVRWNGAPKDFRDNNGKDLGVSINSVAYDPEQIRVSVTESESNQTTYVLGERGNVIFPGETQTLNRDGFKVIGARTRKTLAKVTHREPRKNKKFL